MLFRAALCTMPCPCPIRENAGKFPAGEFQCRLEVRPRALRKNIFWPNDTIKEYPMAVSLYRNGRRLDRKLLPEAAWELDFEKRAIDPDYSGWAIPDVTEKNLAVWESGVETSHLGTLARTVNLGKMGTGLLVTQLSGFERLFRKHVLYAIKKGKLKEIWSFSESIGRGWQWSFVEPVTRNGRNFLVFWSGIQDFAFTGSTEPDTLEIKLLDAGSGVMQITSLPTREFPLYVVWIASYADAVKAREAAQQAQEANRECEDMHALAFQDYPQLPRLPAQAEEAQAVFLGNIFLTLKEAQKYQEAMQFCMGDSRLFFLNGKETTPPPSNAVNSNGN
jgi:hypothetical protein